MKTKGFTLIELLIVVAIIAILAAIAIPNFLAAQVRAKVSRVKGEFATLATALESYQVDNNSYPYPINKGFGLNNTQWNDWTYEGIPESLTTPISYITNGAIRDPFMSTQGYGKSYHFQDHEGCKYQNVGWFNDPDSNVGNIINYWYNGSRNSSIQWDVWSNGPDNISYQYFHYDPTNGTNSSGDIVRFGP